LLRVSLPPPRQTSTPPHTRAPLLTKFTNPPEAQKIAVGGKIPCEIRRSKSLRPRSAPPSPFRILQIPAEIPQSSAGRRRRRLLATDPPPRRSRCRDFQIHLRCFVSPPLCYCRHELSRPARHRGPSRACEARGSLPRKSPLVERRRPLFLAAPALCWCLSGVGVEIHPGVDRFLSVRWFSSSRAEDQSTKVHEQFVSPRIRGVRLNPHARR